MKIKDFLLVISSVLGMMVPNTIYAQPLDSALAFNLFDEAHQAFNRGQVDSVAIICKFIRPYFLETGDFEMYVEASNGIYYSYYHTNNFNLLKEHTFETYEFANEHLDKNSQARLRAINNWGIYLELISNYPAALKLYKSALQEQQEYANTSIETLSFLHNNTGNVYKKLGDVQRSIEYLQKSRELCENYKNCPGSIEYFMQLHNLSKALIKVGNIHEAIDLVDYIINSPKRKNSKQEKQLLVNVKLTLAEILLIMTDYDGMREVLDHTIILQKSIENFELIRTYSLYSKLMLALGNDLQATTYSQLYVNESSVRNNVSQEIEKIESRHLHAKNLFEIGQNDSSLIYFQEGFNLLTGNPLNSSEGHWDELENSIHPQLTLDMLESFIQLHWLVNTKGVPDNFNQTLFNTIPKLIGKASNQIRYEGSKLKHKQKISNQTSFFIDKLMSAYNYVGDEKYCYQAFLYSIRLKNSILRQKLLDLEFEHSLNNSSPLSIKQFGVKTEMSYVQKLIREEKLNDEDGRRKLFALRERLLQFTDSLKRMQPALYAQLNKSFDITSINKIQKYLSETDGSVLDFFQSDSILYVFHLTHDALHSRRIVLSQDLRDVFNRIKISISTVGGLTNGTDGVQSHSNDLHQLYNTIIKPINGQKKLAETVYILPDGFLNSVPLDVFAKSSCIACQSFHDVDYLLHDHVFSYLISPGDLLHEVKEVKELEAAFFAPTYGKSSKLSELKFVADEFEALNNYTQTKQFMGEHVNATLFKQKAANYDIIHLSSHATADENNSANSVIFFSPDDVTQDQATKLYPEDFQSLNLDADMVVLSACETGKGKQYSGEGVYSFSRYFIASGAQSVVHNLWKADDFSTSNILSSFYTFLAKGVNKPRSLRNAKLSYLENTDDYGAHPYFWSTLTVIGNPQPLYEHSNDYLWWMAALLALGLVLVIYMKLR